ncbi:MAG: CoA transferase [Dehalococcoidia bacterium]|nr:CoA transferase [Dehalococcoidia bacterium]|tara:strand:- start:1379 stop:2569 length:1191 start_codon:yes stop_codon:yes gene_type:complete
MPNALDGIRVLDLSQGVAGAYCTKLLAGSGAEVIKIEPLEIGESTRRLSPFASDQAGVEQSLVHLYLNTSKKSVTLDIQSAEGQSVFRRLTKHADLVIESFLPGTMAGLDLGHEQLTEDNPGLVMTSVTFFGQDGPYSGYKGGEIIAQAVSGNLQITGAPDREPLMVGGYLAQYVGGQAACAASLMAVFHSMMTGKGQTVDCSIAEANTDMLDRWGIDAVLGRGDQPRTGIAHHWTFPTQLYPCRDGYVALGIEPAGWGALADMVGDDALRKPEYTGPDRKQYHAEIDPILVNWLEDLGKMEVFEGFQKNRMSSGILMTPEDMLESPQLQARNFFQEVEHPSTGPQMYPGPPYQLSDSEWMQTKAPLLGEHNHEVLVGQLGLPEQELTDLSVKGVT